MKPLLQSNKKMSAYRRPIAEGNDALLAEKAKPGDAHHNNTITPFDTIIESHYWLNL